jgi:hypothetical protein
VRGRRFGRVSSHADAYFLNMIFARRGSANSPLYFDASTVLACFTASLRVRNGLGSRHGRLRLNWLYPFAELRECRAPSSVGEGFGETFSHCGLFDERSVVVSPRDARCEHQQEDAEREDDHERMAWGCCAERRELGGDIPRMFASPLGMVASPVGMVASPLGMVVASPLGVVASPVMVVSALGMVASALGMVGSPLGMVVSPLGMVASTVMSGGARVAVVLVAVAVSRFARD